MPTHQVAVTISIPVKLAAVEQLRAVLEEMGEDATNNSRIPFGQIDGLHFARFVLLDPSTDLAGAMLPARLLFLLDCDAPSKTRLADVVRVGKQGLDDILQHCEGYPGPEQRTGRGRYRYLRANTIPTDVSYVNTQGRPLAQVRAEARLREAIGDFVDASLHEWQSLSGAEVRERIQAFVKSRPDLDFALKPAARPSIVWRIGEWLHRLRVLLTALFFAPLALLAGPLFVFLLRRAEKTDPAPRLVPDPTHLERLAAAEDHLVQNQFTAVGLLKPGRFRRITAVVVLWLVNAGTRHIYNRGVLTGVRTIHAARWVFLDDRRRLAFASNYDGSLENYMGDFIDKVSWGLNAVFSNGLEYPRTNWLVRDGAKDELAFKSYIRVRQVPTQVWYSALGDLTTVGMANNARIRAGLSGEMDDAEIASWLRLL